MKIPSDTKILPSQRITLTGQNFCDNIVYGFIYGQEGEMVNYNKLRHLMIDKKIKKSDLCTMSGISSSTMAKLGKNEVVSLEVLEKICIVLDCDLGDIASFRE